MKKILLFLLLSLPFLAFAQMTCGKLVFVEVDSLSDEYRYTKTIDYLKNKGYTQEEIENSIKDTSVQVVDGIYTFRVINYANCFETYERHRDTFTIYFNQHKVISYTPEGLSYFHDLEEKTSANYLSDYDGTLKKGRSVPLYGILNEEGCFTSNMVHTPSETQTFAGIKGFQVDYQLHYLQNRIGIYHTYVSDQIRLPIKTMLSYPEDVYLCPIFIQTLFPYPKNHKTITTLISATPLSEAEFEQNLREFQAKIKE